MQHYCPGECRSESAEIYELSRDGYKKLLEIGIFHIEEKE